jgi:hypothetical protein
VSILVNGYQSSVGIHYLYLQGSQMKEEYSYEILGITQHIIRCHRPETTKSRQMCAMYNTFSLEECRLLGY